MTQYNPGQIIYVHCNDHVIRPMKIQSILLTETTHEYTLIHHDLTKILVSEDLHSGTIFDTFEEAMRYYQ